MSNSKNEKLIKLRQQIDEIDHKLIELLSQRMKLVTQVGMYKKNNHIPPLDTARWQQVVESRKKWAIECGLSPSFIEEIFDLLHEQALVIEEAV